MDQSYILHDGTLVGKSLKIDEAFEDRFLWGVELFPFNYARGTPKWLAVFPLATIISGILYWIFYPTLWFVISGFGSLILMIPLSLFFRDPERKIGDGVVSPADGKVMSVERRQGNWWFVSIFMNIHNVHVNRAPWDCVVVSQEHIPGGYVPAFNKDSDRNERIITKLRTRNGTWEIAQIAGAVARRIIPYTTLGQPLEKGQRFGLIRYGSRVDLLFKMPKGMIIDVEVGQRVLAGTVNVASPKQVRHHRMRGE
jgi:phosphatidylserine decarboxylase